MERGIVAVLAVAALAVVLVNIYTGAFDPGYADLVPAPDAVVLREGDEITFWLSTNRRSVDLRVGNIAVGLGDLQRLGADSGQVVTLGRSTGCLDWLVSGLTVATVGDTTVSIDGTLDRGNSTSTLTVHVRVQGVSRAAVGTRSVSGPAGATFDYNLTGLPTNTAFQVDASHDEHFPTAETRSVTFTTGDPESGTSETVEEELLLLEGTGIGLVGCHEQDDTVVTLHGADGTELKRYMVDVLEPLTLNSPPDFGADYTGRLVCVDDATDRGTYLDGGETVGAALTATDSDGDGVAYALGVDDHQHYLFFSVNSSGQLSVNEAGANDTSGLDADRVYPLVLTATDGNGGSDRIIVAVQLDTANEATGDDGVCP